MSEPVLKVSGLTHRFGPGRGIEAVSFEVAAGEVLGYLGPNGAGKTTTLRHVMGFLRPQAGTVHVLGRDAAADAAAVHRDVGSLAADITLFGGLTPRVQLHLVLAVRRRPQAAAYAEQLAQRFAVDLDTPVSRLSRGRQQAAALLVAFAHDPTLLLLDEPTTGLDPVLQDRFLEWILEEKRRGKAILLSSHRFDEVERTADRVMLLAAGRVVAEGSLEAVKAQRTHRFRLDFGSRSQAAAFAAEVRGQPGVISAAEAGLGVDLAVADALPAVARAAGTHGVTGWHEQGGGLEDAFRRLYGLEPEAARREVES